MDRRFLSRTKSSHTKISWDRGSRCSISNTTVRYHANNGPVYDDQSTFEYADRSHLF